MKNYLFIIVALGFLAIPFIAARADDKGTAIAQAVYDRPDGKTAVTKTTMILESKGSQKRVREFYSYRKDFSDEQIKSLIRFTVPADVKDTGLLTHNHETGDNDQWLYLPALTRSRRIAGDRKGGRFVGSDLYYEDLQDRKVNKDNHTFLRQEEFNGALCDVIESVPVDQSNSTYSKRIMWVHPQTMIPIRVDFFQKKEAPVKRLTVQKIDKIQNFWTVMETHIVDLKTDHKTIIGVQNIKYDQTLPDHLFAQSVLQDASREVSFRP